MLIKNENKLNIKVGEISQYKDNKVKITGKFSDISCNTTRTSDNKIQYLCTGYVKIYYK